MRLECPQCGNLYQEGTREFCPEDGAPLRETDSMIGTVLNDRFRLDSLLGAGGMGRVYRGTQLSVDRAVAIKLLRMQIADDATLRARFMREARVISGFSHPNIVRLIDFGYSAERGFPYIVMEHVGGIPLGDLMEKGRLRTDLVVEITRQICDALSEAHASQVVHRDLKPDNLHLLSMANGALQIKVLDFGIAAPKNTEQKLTSTGMICGTATYMSPEQVQGSDLDGRADLYSLGVIVYEMLSGVLPFDGESNFQILIQHVQQPHPPLSDIMPPGAVPPRLVSLVDQLLAKNPNERPARATDVLTELEAIRADAEWKPARVSGGSVTVEELEPWILPRGSHSDGFSDRSPTTGPQPSATGHSSRRQDHSPRRQGHSSRRQDHNPRRRGHRQGHRRGRSRVHTWRRRIQRGDRVTGASSPSSPSSCC